MNFTKTEMYQSYPRKGSCTTGRIWLTCTCQLQIPPSKLFMSLLRTGPLKQWCRKARRGKNFGDGKSIYFRGWGGEVYKYAKAINPVTLTYSSVLQRIIQDLRSVWHRVRRGGILNIRKETKPFIFQTPRISANTFFLPKNFF